MNPTPPSLAEHMALDLACSALADSTDLADRTAVTDLADGGLLAVVSTDLAAESVGLRMPTARILREPDLAGATGSFSGALWVSPTRGWRREARAIDGLLHSGAALAVVGAGPLLALRGRFGPPADSLLRDAVPAGRVGRALGYQQTAEWQLYGPRAALMGLRRGAALRLGRRDLADRYEAAHREALLPSQSARRLWLVGVWVGRKPA